MAKKKTNAVESAAAKILAKKSNDTPAPTKTKNNKLTQSPLTDVQIIDRARDWAQLHADPKTRDKMDDIIKGLSAADSRRVILCGQRIRAGLTPRIAK
jgi:hypothetical protein